LQPTTSRIHYHTCSYQTEILYAIHTSKHIRHNVFRNILLRLQACRQYVSHHHCHLFHPHSCSQPVTSFRCLLINFIEKGAPYPLSNLSNKVVLVVNTASKCGFTPQFAGLEKLYKDLKTTYPNDFEIIGFPCNQFGGQDPGSNDEIQSFCQVNYGVSFPVLGKIDVNGDKADPAFEWLKNEKPGLMGLKRVKWNFEKFLVGRDGKVKGRWASTKKPEDLKAEIEKEIKASKA
jgi:glutathione peroxidase-family protein